VVLQQQAAKRHPTAKQQTNISLTYDCQHDKRWIRPRTEQLVIKGSGHRTSSTCFHQAGVKPHTVHAVVILAGFQHAPADHVWWGIQLASIHNRPVKGCHQEPVVSPINSRRQPSSLLYDILLLST
jgi:hypothetical protein